MGFVCPSLRRGRLLLSPSPNADGGAVRDAEAVCGIKDFLVHLQTA